MLFFLQWASGESYTWCLEIIFKYLNAKRENALATRFLSNWHPQSVCSIKFASLCNGVAPVQSSTQMLSSFNKRDGRIWSSDTTPSSAKERLLHVKIPVWYMLSINLWTQMLIYLIFKCMLIFWQQNIISALQNNLLLTNLLSSSHRYCVWYCRNSMCYSLILYLSELNRKNCSFRIVHGIVHVFHYKTEKKNVVWCNRGYCGIYFCIPCKL